MGCPSQCRQSGQRQYRRFRWIQAWRPAAAKTGPIHLPLFGIRAATDLFASMTGQFGLLDGMHGQGAFQPDDPNSAVLNSYSDGGRRNDQNLLNGLLRERTDDSQIKFSPNVATTAGDVGTDTQVAGEGVLGTVAEASSSWLSISSPDSPWIPEATSGMAICRIGVSAVTKGTMLRKISPTTSGALPR